MLDSCLFEPGAWSPSALNEAPTLIPDLSRATLSTPCGLLFNELVQSPKELMGHVRRILDLATDMALLVDAVKQKGTVLDGYKTIIEAIAAAGG